MMFPSSPISGLSLFVHLLIILLAKIYIFFQVVVFGATSGNTAKAIQKASAPSLAVVWFKTALSLFVVAVMLMATVSFLSIAIQTGFREGAREPQRMFMSNIFSDVKESHRAVGLAIPQYAGDLSDTSSAESYVAIN